MDSLSLKQRSETGSFFKIHVLLQKVTTPYAVSGFGWFKMKGFYFGNF